MFLRVLRASVVNKEMAERKGKGIFGWLGRQVGYVKKAVKTPVPTPPKKVYENKTVEEAPHPDDPNIKLRRTVIDEAIEKKKGDE